MTEKLDPLVCLTPWAQCFIPSSRDMMCEGCGAHGALSPETEKQIEKLKGDSTPHYFCDACFVKEAQEKKVSRITPPSEGQLREIRESRPELN